MSSMHSQVTPLTHRRGLSLPIAVAALTFSMRSYAVLNLLAAFLLCVVFLAIVVFAVAALVAFVDGLDSLIGWSFAHCRGSSFQKSHVRPWRIT
jgi:hypothetical protein